jgi:hypothetical protein
MSKGAHTEEAKRSGRRHTSKGVAAEGREEREEEELLHVELGGCSGRRSWFSELLLMVSDLIRSIL